MYLNHAGNPYNPEKEDYYGVAFKKPLISPAQLHARRISAAKARAVRMQKRRAGDLESTALPSNTAAH